MYTIKPLNWKKNSCGTVFAEPSGLMWMYYITPISKDNKFELTLINEYCETNTNLWVSCDSLDQAKSLATKHYMATLTKLLIRDQIRENVRN